MHKENKKFVYIGLKITVMMTYLGIGKTKTSDWEHDFSSCDQDVLWNLKEYGEVIRLNVCVVQHMKLKKTCQSLLAMYKWDKTLVDGIVQLTAAVSATGHGSENVHQHVRALN